MPRDWTTSYSSAWNGDLKVLEGLSGIRALFGASVCAEHRRKCHEVASAVNPVEVVGREDNKTSKRAMSDMPFRYRFSLLKRSITRLLATPERASIPNKRPCYLVLSVTFALVHPGHRHRELPPLRAR